MFGPIQDGRWNWEFHIKCALQATLSMKWWERKMYPWKRKPDRLYMCTCLYGKGCVRNRKSLFLFFTLPLLILILPYTNIKKSIEKYTFLFPGSLYMWLELFFSYVFDRSAFKATGSYFLFGAYILIYRFSLILNNKVSLDAVRLGCRLRDLCYNHCRKP